MFLSLVFIRYLLRIGSTEANINDVKKSKSELKYNQDLFEQVKIL